MKSKVLALVCAIIAAPAISFASCFYTPSAQTLETVKRYYVSQTKKLLDANGIEARSISVQIGRPERYAVEVDALWYYAQVTVISKAGNSLGLVGYHGKPGQGIEKSYQDFGVLFTVTSGKTFSNEGTPLGCSKPELTLSDVYVSIANLKNRRWVKNDFGMTASGYFDRKEIQLK